MNQITTEPDLHTFGQVLKRDALLSMNCHALGTVDAFDAPTQSAKVSINYKRKLADGTLKDYPQLVDCPCVVLGGGAGHLTFPVAQGDSCLVFFNDRDMDAWLSGGHVGGEPTTDRLHSYSDALVLVGIHAFPQALAGYSTDKVQLFLGTTILELGTTIKLANGTTDLKTLLNGLIDLVNTMVGQITPTTGMTSPNIAANVAAFTAYKAVIAGLLT